MPIDDLGKLLGTQIRDLRLRRNIGQEELSRQAGISLNSVKNLERGRGATIGSLIRVLRTLGREDWLSTLSPETTISPIQLIKAGRERQRASRKRDGGHV